jgi:predicted lipoprotein with Yx(FWY)xxD motif
VRYDAGLGYLLTSQAGMTLYVFGKDTPGTSTCYDACAENWPPLLADEAFAAPLAVPGAFSVIDRNDGGKQVAYNGMPLYTWAHDANPGDAAGQGVGNVWWVANLQPALQLLATANGNLVVGPTGMALYTYDKDAAGSSNCAGGCAKNWPPAVGGFAPADGHGVTVADGVKGTVDLIPRADSKGMQLTLNGAPLYYWIHDTAPGQTSGDGVGGVWHRAVQ